MPQLYESSVNTLIQASLEGVAAVYQRKEHAYFGTSRYASVCQPEFIVIAGVWILLLFLVLLFLGLYLAERGASTGNREPAKTTEPIKAIEPNAARVEPGVHPLYVDDAYDPFADFKLTVDSRGVERTQISDKGMVVTDEGDCSDLAGSVLNKGGNAVDAAVVAVLCMGLRHPMSSGAGGGAFILVRFPNGTATAIDAREVAPRNSSKDMFKGICHIFAFFDESSLGRGALEGMVGGLAIGVPLELKGLETLWKMYGRWQWKRLVQLVIPMAKNGITADSYLLRFIKTARNMDVAEAVGFFIMKAR